MNKKLNGALALVGLLTVASYTVDVTTKTTKKLIKKYNEKKSKSKVNAEVIKVEEFEVVSELLKDLLADTNIEE